MQLGKLMSYTYEEIQSHFISSSLLLKKNFVNIVAAISSVSSRYTRAVMHIEGMSAHSAEWMKELFWRHSQQPGL